MLSNTTPYSKVSYVVLMLLFFAFSLNGCSSTSSDSSNGKSSAKHPRLSPEERLHRAIFSQDLERVQFAITQGADVNQAINKSDHKLPAIEMPVTYSSPLNAIISDYKYQDQMFVAPLQPGHSYNLRAIEIVQLLLEAGADVKSSQFYPNKKQNIAFELGGPRLALAMPFLIDAGFEPSIEDISHAYQHYDSFKKSIELNNSVLSYIKKITGPLPKKIKQFIARYETEVLEKLENEKQAKEEAEFKKQKYEEMLAYAEQFRITEGFNVGQKACIFDDYYLTLGFIVSVKHSPSTNAVQSPKTIKFKPAYSYRFDGQGYKRGTRQREKSVTQEVPYEKVSLCPSGA